MMPLLLFLWKSLRCMSAALRECCTIFTWPLRQRGALCSRGGCSTDEGRHVPLGSEDQMSLEVGMSQ
jgi:hypothetical protein